MPVGEIDGVDIPLGTHLEQIISDALKIAWATSQHG